MRARFPDGVLRLHDPALCPVAVRTPLFRLRERLLAQYRGD